MQVARRVRVVMGQVFDPADVGPDNQGERIELLRPVNLIQRLR